LPIGFCQAGGADGCPGLIKDGEASAYPTREPGLLPPFRT
jgi:hypothetical protein